MERVFNERNKSLGTGEKSNECKHWSKLFSCPKRILRKLAQWVMMSSFSPLNYWKNLPLWAVCMCLCWVRTWHSSFSTHFCYKKVPFVSCNPKKVLAWTLSVFHIFDTVNVGTVVLCFTWKVMPTSLGSIFPTCSISVLYIFLFAVQPPFIPYASSSAWKGCKCTMVHRNHVCWKHSEIFLLNLLAYFQWKAGSSFIMPPAYGTGASEKMMCSVRLRKHSCKHHRAQLGWAQQLWGGVTVKCAISSKIWDEDVF